MLFTLELKHVDMETCICKFQLITDGTSMYILQSGGPKWNVPKGRKDGRTSKASETRQLPAPTFNISQLQQSFSQRALSVEDLVALSGKLFLRLLSLLIFPEQNPKL